MRFSESSQWLKRLFPTQREKQRRPKPVTRARLQLEALENRLVLATLNVGGGGFATINAAIAAASNGDTINVAAGIYAESVLVNKSLTINGAQAGVLGVNQVGATSLVSGLGANSYGFIVAASNVTINGFYIQLSPANSAGIGIAPPISGVTPSTISNVQILNNVIENNAFGLYLTGTNVNVQGNWFKTNNAPGSASGTGIYSEFGSANVTIADNVFQGHNSSAITFAQIADPTIRGNAADPFRNKNLLVTRNSFSDINLGTFTDVTGGTISFNTVSATQNVSNIGIAGGVIGMTILDNTLIGGSRGVSIVTTFDPVANSGVVVSVSNQFFNHTVAGLRIDAGAHTGNVNATFNVWNSSMGPTTPANPTGLGEAIVAPDNNFTFYQFSVIPHFAAVQTGAYIGLNANQKFVQALYIRELNRQGSVAELNSWVAVLTGPGGSQALVANNIARSAEARNQLVTLWYKTYLGRTPTNNEQAGFVNQLVAQGKTEETVISQIVGSLEFYNRAQTLIPSGTSDQRFVQACYNVYLGRNGSAAEISGWVNRIPSAGIQGVALQMITDTVPPTPNVPPQHRAGFEYRLYLFQQYYNVLLHRVADNSPLITAADSGADQCTVRVAIESSNEFFVVGPGA